MKTYVRLATSKDGQIVAEVITPPVIDGEQVAIGDMFTSEFVDSLIDVTDVSPQPQQWWTFNGTTFSPPMSTS
ncbi:hypothetical protein [Burkholderia multivorans]|uniref:hypothetical protein n=1 Tax=Burkholderia multivorans TaxID=87883 RepID=UPI0021BECB96|nr:hypothetical protein [Burkholderia multivorans]MDR9177897.1 hypothetical protein [Burkholderia multivorans]MDR9184017.1 hypothetical protein [Burkholderia multivorans]MDR9187489.1 hypothetical protein [Burkholderia multivorans]MDR9195225.1 hypothetical protein [Burkholderia multivorans]MDR9200921.1 hypothetical protein [Burkholderia multivorans]